MSRNARSRENGRFDEISSNGVNVRGFDDFGEFLVKIVKAKSARRNWRFRRIFTIFVTACISGRKWGGFNCN